MSTFTPFTEAQRQEFAELQDRLQRELEDRLNSLIKFIASGYFLASPDVSEEQLKDVEDDIKRLHFLVNTRQADGGLKRPERAKALQLEIKPATKPRKQAARR